MTDNKYKLTLIFYDKQSPLYKFHCNLFKYKKNQIKARRGVI